MLQLHADHSIHNKHGLIVMISIWMSHGLALYAIDTFRTGSSRICSLLFSEGNSTAKSLLMVWICCYQFGVLIIHISVFAKAYMTLRHARQTVGRKQLSRLEKHFMFKELLQILHGAFVCIAWFATAILEQYTWDDKLVYSPALLVMPLVFTVTFLSRFAVQAMVALPNVLNKMHKYQHE